MLRRNELPLLGIICYKLRINLATATGTEFPVDKSRDNKPRGNHELNVSDNSLKRKNYKDEYNTISNQSIKEEDSSILRSIPCTLSQYTYPAHRAFKHSDMDSTSARPVVEQPLNIRNPLPLSATQEQQVKDIYYKRVRGYCASEIKGRLPFSLSVSLS